MRPVSLAFQRTVAGSHTMLARATVCESFQTGTTPVGTRIPIVAGDVQVDGTAQIRSTLDLTTDGNRRWPQLATDLLTPYGNEIYIERGIQYSDALVEWVGLGYFRIQSPEQDQAPDGPIRVEGRDRMAGIIDGRLLAPRQFHAGTTLGSVVADLVHEVYPEAVIVWDDATNLVTLARSVITEEDRYAFLDDLIRAQAKIWYWNHRGELAITAVPDPGAPVAEITAGRGGTLLELSRRLSREGVYNAVVAAGEGADTQTPARGVAVDNSRSSPTYFYGRFGPVPRFYTSPFLANDVQAYNAAEAILRRGLGLPYSLDLSTLPNPAFEPWDPVRVRPGVRDRAETHVLERLSIPLVAQAALTADCREQTVVLVGSA
jgi:Domain of unknown function (DUF5047)